MSVSAEVLAPVCVNAAALLPVHGPFAWVPGGAVATVTARLPSGLGALSASGLEASKV